MKRVVHLFLLFFLFGACDDDTGDSSASSSGNCSTEASTSSSASSSDTGWWCAFDSQGACICGDGIEADPESCECSLDADGACLCGGVPAPLDACEAQARDSADAFSGSVPSRTGSQTFFPDGSQLTVKAPRLNFLTNGGTVSATLYFEAQELEALHQLASGAAQANASFELLPAAGGRLSATQTAILVDDGTMVAQNAWPPGTLQWLADATVAGP